MKPSMGLSSKFVRSYGQVAVWPNMACVFEWAEPVTMNGMVTICQGTKHRVLAVRESQGKTGKWGRSGKVREFCKNGQSQGKVRENHNVRWSFHTRSERGRNNFWNEVYSWKLALDRPVGLLLANLTEHLASQNMCGNGTSWKAVA